MPYIDMWVLILKVWQFLSFTYVEKVFEWNHHSFGIFVYPFMLVDAAVFWNELKCMNKMPVKSVQVANQVCLCPVTMLFLLHGASLVYS